MDRKKIGMYAGKVWQLLSNHQEWDYKALKKMTGLSDNQLGAAIGWLSKEDKIEFREDQEDIHIFVHVNVFIG